MADYLVQRNVGLLLFALVPDVQDHNFRFRDTHIHHYGAALMPLDDGAVVVDDYGVAIAQGPNAFLDLLVFRVGRLQGLPGVVFCRTKVF